MFQVWVSVCGEVVFNVCRTVIQPSVALIGVYACHVEGDVWNLVKGSALLCLAVVPYTLVAGVGAVSTAVALCEKCSTSSCSGCFV